MYYAQRHPHGSQREGSAAVSRTPDLRCVGRGGLVRGHLTIDLLDDRLLSRPSRMGDQMTTTSRICEPAASRGSQRVAPGEPGRFVRGLGCNVAFAPPHRRPRSPTPISIEAGVRGVRDD